MINLLAKIVAVLAALQLVGTLLVAAYLLVFGEWAAWGFGNRVSFLVAVLFSLVATAAYFLIAVVTLRLSGMESQLHNTASEVSGLREDLSHARQANNASPTRPIALGEKLDQAELDLRPQLQR